MALKSEQKLSFGLSEIGLGELTLGQKVMGVTRIVLGFLFLWPFLDKMFGLGYATQPGSAWINGVSPTKGFLMFATYKTTPWAGLWEFLASDPIYILVDITYMTLLLVGGVALITGCFVRPASFGLTIFMIAVYLALLPLLPPEGVPSYNPIIDDHIIYALILIVFMVWPVGEWLGLGKKWSELSFVQKYPFLK